MSGMGRAGGVWSQSLSCGVLMNAEEQGRGGERGSQVGGHGGGRHQRSERERKRDGYVQSGGKGFDRSRTGSGNAVEAQHLCSMPQSPSLGEPP